MGLEQGEKNYNVEQHEKVKVEKPEVSMYPDSDRRTVMDLPFSDKIRPMTEVDEGSSSERESIEDYEKPQWCESDMDIESIETLKESPESTDENVSNQESNAEQNSDSPEKRDDGTRELTEEEKQKLKDTLGWPDERIKKCTIDENGVYHYKTDRCDLEGKTAKNGVPYARKQIEINGIKIEGVFPVFDSVFDTQLDEDNLKTKAYAKVCNEKLKEAIKNDPELRSKFTEEQLKDIEEGRTPTGYVWHHNEEPGKMQLVKREDHDRAIGGAAHTGGNSLWGADSVDNGKKGESF